VTKSQYLKEWRRKNLTHAKELRRRYYYSHRRESIQKTLDWQNKNIEERRVYWREYRRKRREKDKIKIVARRAVRDAVRKGILKRTPCIQCGKKRVNGHHHDYSKPLSVIWLCRTHHDLLHHPLSHLS